MFTGDFKKDLDLIDPFAAPFALGRFGDGEHAILTCREIKGADGWDSSKVPADARVMLYQALISEEPGWNIGISCPCCDQEAFDFYSKRPGIDPHVTYNNLFANGNWRKFVDRAMEGGWDRKCALVGSHENASVRIPSTLANEPQALSICYQIAGDLCKATTPILLACGPMSAVIAHLYWKTAYNKQTIIDIGSAFDPFLFGRATRGYHMKDSPTSKKVCSFVQ